LRRRKCAPSCNRCSRDRSVPLSASALHLVIPRPKELDGDVIVAALAPSIAGDDDEMIVATTNADQLDRFVLAGAWRDIPPE
jgi:hypothetical protein